MQQLVWSCGSIGLIFRDGWAGTNSFILLSGFGLDQGFRDRLLASTISASGFFWDRYKRIAPRYLIALACFVAVLVLSRALGFNRHFSENLAGLLSEALVLNALGLDIGGGWNGHSWTVSALMACYLVFSILVRVPRLLLVLPLIIAGWLDHAFLSYNYKASVVRALPVFMAGVALSGCARSDGKPNTTKGLVEFSFALYLTHSPIVVTLATRLTLYINTTDSLHEFYLTNITASIAYALVFEWFCKRSLAFFANLQIRRDYPDMRRFWRQSV